MKNEAQMLTLPNGIRVAQVYSTSKATYCGLTINTGTRDELNNEHGMAHFLEHTLFKGTKKRKPYHINNRLENVGGELNAYTTKEETVIHAVTLKSDLEKAIELITDITFNSTFPDKEIDKEKTVVLDEIDSYRDSPSELIFDDFEDLLFAGSSLGRNTLGTKQSVKSINSAKIRNFIQRTYNTNEMVFSVVGKIPFTKVERWCNEYLAIQPANIRNFTRQHPPVYVPFTKKVNKSTYQAHCVIGNRAYELDNENRIALSLLMNLLGGPMSSSVLNTVLREKHGLVYNIETNYSAYTDTGAINIYFGTSKQNLDKSIELVMRELDKVCNTALSSTQLLKAKKQLIGQLTIANESYEQQMLNAGKSLLVFNKIDTLEQVISQIQAVTTSQLLRVANECLNSSQLSTLIYT